MEIINDMNDKEIEGEKLFVNKIESKRQRRKNQIIAQSNTENIKVLHIKWLKGTVEEKDLADAFAHLKLEKVTKFQTVERTKAANAVLGMA